MVTDRDYKPQPVKDWADIIREKDAEIAKLEHRIRVLEERLYAQERQFHVDMGR